MGLKCSLATLSREEQMGYLLTTLGWISVITMGVLDFRNTDWLHTRPRTEVGVMKQLSLASDFLICADFSVSIFAGYASLL